LSIISIHRLGLLSLSSSIVLLILTASAFGGTPQRAYADFALSESPRYVGRGVVALAIDPGRARWNKQSVSSGQLASEYGFKDLDGSQPDIWRYMKEFHELGLNVNPNDYR
jgi:hypothetical protein